MHRRFLIILGVFLLIASVNGVGQINAQGGEPVELLEINPDDFDPMASANIDNQWLPMQPGMQFSYEGQALSDDEVIERRIVTIVTDLTKEIHGINSVVLWIRDYNDDEMIESELAFIAQDKDGNIWYLGEYVEVYEEEELIGGHVWLPDLPEDAKAGIFMWADPQEGMPIYSQGFAPEPINWTDRALISATGQEVCIELDCYENVLVINEASADSEGEYQVKYYAPGVGNIKVGYGGDDPEQEELELVELVELSSDELDEAREGALELETRAYLYSQTPPAQPRG